MPAPTQVSIINLSLSHLGQKPIQSITEVTVQAQTAMRVWDFALKEALRSYNWGFAKVNVALAEVSTYTPLTYKYAYAYPAQCVAIRKILNEATPKQTIGEKFREMYDPNTNQIIIETDCADAYAEYTYLVTDVTKYDSYFITALSHRLATELAMPLNGDKEMAETQIKIFNDQISEAHRHSSYENLETHEANEQSAIVDARG
jgi:hypothetical protein